MSELFIIFCCIYFHSVASCWRIRTLWRATLILCEVMAELFNSDCCICFFSVASCWRIRTLWRATLILCVDSVVMAELFNSDCCISFQCGKLLKNKNSLGSHLKMMHSEDNDGYKYHCMECGKSFRQKGRPTGPCSQNSGSYPFQCWGYYRPKHKDAMTFENHLNPIMMVFIG